MIFKPCCIYLFIFFGNTKKYTQNVVTQHKPSFVPASLSQACFIDACLRKASGTQGRPHYGKDPVKNVSKNKLATH